MNTMNSLKRSLLVVGLLTSIIYTAHAQSSKLMQRVRLGTDATNTAVSYTVAKLTKGKKSAADTLTSAQLSVLKDTTVNAALKKMLLWVLDEKNADFIPELNQEEITLIHHTGFESAMHTAFNIPVWVSHSINKKDLNNPDPALSREGSKYPQDPEYPKLKGNLYASSGYDHGHIAPARDFKHDADQYYECFYMTNMSPQHGCLNQKGWCYLESVCREWARESEQTTTYIVSGPLLNAIPGQSIFIDTLCVREDLQIMVPAYFYKAVCVYNAKLKEARTIAFIVPNRNVEDMEIPSMKLSVDQLEKLSGIDFFEGLPDAIEKKAESKVGNFSFDYRSECSSKACSTVYSNRATPEERTRLRCDE